MADFWLLLCLVDFTTDDGGDDFDDDGDDFDDDGDDLDATSDGDEDVDGSDDDDGEDEDDDVVAVAVDSSEDFAILDDDDDDDETVLSPLTSDDLSPFLATSWVPLTPASPNSSAITTPFLPLTSSETAASDSAALSCGLFVIFCACF